MTPDVSFHALFVDGPLHLYVRTATKSRDLMTSFLRLELLVRALAKQLSEEEDEASYDTR
jgi:hypothetical protein